MLFTYLSSAVDPNSTSKIAAQVISRIGFLGGEMILNGTIDKTLAIGFNYYIIAIAAVAFAVLVSRTSHISKNIE